MKTESEKTSHLTTEQLLDYIEEKLSVDDVKRVEEHLATDCASCQEEAAWLRETLSLMKTDVWLTPPAHLSASVRRMYREQQPKALPSFSIRAWLESLWSQPRPVAVAFAAALVLIIVLSLVFQSQFGPSADQEAAVASTEGTVLVRPSGSETWQPADEETALDTGSQIRTGDDSSVTLVFPDKSQTVASPNTELEILRMTSSEDGNRNVIVMRQTLGQTLNTVEPARSANSRFEIQTPSATIVVRGTEFTVDVDQEGGTAIAVMEGTVEVTALGTTVALTAGQSTRVPIGGPPPTVEVTPTPTDNTSRQTTPTGEIVDPTRTTSDDLNAATRAPEATFTSTATATRTPTPATSLTPTRTPTPFVSQTPVPPTSTPSGGDGSDGNNTPTPTKQSTATATSVPPSPPSPTEQQPEITPTSDGGTHVPPGLTKTPEPPGQTKTPQAGTSDTSVKTN